MKNIRKSLKNLTICFMSFLFLCSQATQTYAMKRAQPADAPLSTQEASKEKYQKLPPPWPSAPLGSWADAVEEEESEFSPPPPVYSTSPVPPDPTTFFEIKFLYNPHNDCKTLRVDPKRDLIPDQKLNGGFLKNFIEYHRKEIFDIFRIENPTFINIFKAFDIICVDNRVKTEPDQILNHQDWLILRRGLNATLYINRDHLKKSIQQNVDALNYIICFALYV